MKKDDEVALFLNEFKQKMQIWGILYRDDRGKNTQCLLDLEIRAIDREKVLKELSIEDYSEGPIAEYRYVGVWENGKK